MSDVVLGVVQQVDVSEKKTKFGSKPSVGVKVNDVWYSAIINNSNAEALNKVRESIKEGDSVKVFYTVNGEYKNLASVEKIAKESPVAQQVQKQASDKDLRISYAGSVEDAIPFVDLLIRNGGLTLPKKVSDIADALEEAVHYYALQFTKRAFSITPADLEDQYEPTEVQVGGKQLSE